MTEAEREVWQFAVEHPDYWPLLQTQEDEQEVASLSAPDKEAFNAARVVAQDRAVDLLRACWDDLQKRAQGTKLGEWMPNRPQRATILAGKMNSSLPNLKGRFYIALAPMNGRLSTLATLYCAKKRLDDAAQAWGDGDSVYTDGSSYSVFLNIDPTRSDAAHVAAFTDDYWPRLANWLGYDAAPDPDEADGDDDDLDADEVDEPDRDGGDSGLVERAREDGESNRPETGLGGKAESGTDPASSDGDGDSQ